MGYCFSIGYTINSWDEEGELLGTATAVVMGSAQLDPRSGTWTEDDLISVPTASGNMANAFATFSASCTSPCTADQPVAWTTGTMPMVAPESLPDSITYTDIPAAGTENFIRTAYNFNLLPASGAVTINDANWSSTQQIRCDTTMKNSTGALAPGCAIPAFKPNYNFDVATYGAAGYLYYFTQHYWTAYDASTGAGIKKGIAADPFTYQYGSSDAHQAKTCGTGASRAFIPKPGSVVDYSCDEFPFAMTAEGGIDGGLCGEVVPQQATDGSWHMYAAYSDIPVTLKEPCVRGHVPSAENSKAGSDLGVWIQQERIIDLDYFSVSTTMP
jgi:hypothetical protein